MSKEDALKALEEEYELEVEFIECWNCFGEGVIDGECTCMDDCCCCLEPEPPICDICHGKGGWKVEENADS